MVSEDRREERIQTYLARAGEARGAALETTDPVAKASFEKVAQGWEQLAMHLTNLRGIGR